MLKPLCVIPSLDNLLPTPAFFRIFTVPGSRIPALILYATCNAVFFSNIILSISFFDSKRERRRPEGPPPIINTLVSIRLFI